MPSQVKYYVSCKLAQLASCSNLWNSNRRQVNRTHLDWKQNSFSCRSKVNSEYDLNSFGWRPYWDSTGNTWGDGGLTKPLHSMWTAKLTWTQKIVSASTHVQISRLCKVYMEKKCRWHSYSHTSVCKGWRHSSIDLVQSYWDRQKIMQF